MSLQQTSEVRPLLSSALPIQLIQYAVDLADKIGYNPNKVTSPPYRLQPTPSARGVLTEPGSAIVLVSGCPFAAIGAAEERHYIITVCVN